MVAESKKPEGDADPRSKIEKVSARWGEFAQGRASDPGLSRMFAMDHPIVQEYVYGTYLDGESPFVFLRRFLPRVPCRQGLEIACGSGDLSIAVVKTGVCERVDAFDISEQAIEVAERSAEGAGIGTIRFAVDDGNTMVLPPNSYDLIYVSHSLHHIERLEHLFGQIHGALTDDGVFFVSDYVGPSRMQWTDKQLEIMNMILGTLPARLRRSLLHDGQVRDVIERTPIERFLEIDPSEGVRSGEILPLVRSHFDLLELRPMGCSVIYEVLLGIVGNFDDRCEEDTAMLRLMCAMEKLLVQEGVLPSDFACFAARKSG